MAALERVYDLNITGSEPSPEKQYGWGYDAVRSDKVKQMRKNVAIAGIRKG